eukprot:1178004-Pleurochrysis_carterae.AAC.4
MYPIDCAEGGGLIMLVENNIQMIAKADFDLALHHGLFDRGQVDIQVGHQQQVGKLNDCIAGRDNNSMPLPPGTIAGMPFSARS